MEKELNDLELIENFLDKKLSENQITQFEERLLQDEEFASMFKDLQWIIPGIEQSGKSALKEQFADFAKELPPFSASGITSDLDLENDFGVSVTQNHLKVTASNTQQAEVKGTFFNMRYAIAASLSLIIVAAFIFFNKTSPEKAYQLAYNEIGEGAYTFLADSDNPPLNRSDLSQKSLDAEEQAYQNYQALEFEKALENFEIAKPELGEQNTKMLFYLGNTYLALNKPKEAIETFNELLALPDNITRTYVSKTKWYLGLSYLKANDMDKAEEIFVDLSQNATDSYKEKAEQALDQINWGLF